MFQYSRTRLCYSFGLPSTMRPRQDPHNAATNLSGRITAFWESSPWPRRFSLW